MTTTTITTSPKVHRWRAFALLAVAYFMSVVDLTIVNVSLPTIGRDLHFSTTSLQWVATAYALTFGGFLLLGGRAADLLGRRRVLMAGIGLFSGASLACGLATSDAFLIGARAVQGIGAAIMMPAALSIVMNMFEEGAERNKALGIWGALAASGATVGLVTGGLLTRYAGWEYIFYLNVPIGIGTLLLAPRIVPESRVAAQRRRFDALGALTGTGGLVLLVDAIAQAPQYGWGGTRTVAGLAAAVGLLIAFVVVERRVESPLLPLEIFRRRTLNGADTAGLLLGGSFFAFFFVGTLYMQQVLHYSALQSGVAWLATSITSVALAGLSQYLVTRIGPKVVMAIGMTMIGTGVIWATQVPVQGHYVGNLARTVRRRRRRDRVRVHPNLDRRARRRRRAPGGTRVGALEHQPAARRSDRDCDRLERRRQPHPGAAAHRPRRPHGTHRRLPARTLGARRDRARRHPGDFRPHATE